MKLLPVKGTRDFYPEDMALRNWLTDAWRRVSLRNGFVEFDGPAIEYLDLYRAKSGDEIVSQLFNFQDRGGRELALRPEITPTLARMVNAKFHALPRPIKWFSVSRLWRGEAPQRGRLREFFQWNVDIIGGENSLSDAECVLVAVDALRELGLTAGDAQVRYSSRRLLAEVLRAFAVTGDAAGGVLPVLDKRSKLPAVAWDEMFQRAVPDASARAGVLRFLNMTSLADDPAAVAADMGIAATDELTAALADVRQFQAALRAFGIAEWCVYDTGIVRGLAYYTGIVYEVFDTPRELRALAGGGRYDNLLAVLGGPTIGATGFGMGDPVLAILLERQGKLPGFAARLDCFVLTEQENLLPKVLALTAGLRRANVAADFSPKAQPIGKALKEANRRGSRYAAIVGEGGVGLKNLSTGQQIKVPSEEFLASPGNFLQ